MTTFTTLDFEGDTIGSAPTLPADWTNSGTAPTVETAAAAEGTKGARWASTGSHQLYRYDTGSNQTVMVITRHVNFRSDSTNCYFGSVWTLPASGSQIGDMRRNNAGGTITIRDGFTATDTSTASLSLNTWYTIESRYDQGTGTQEHRFYALGTTTPLFTLSGVWSSTSTRVAGFGPTTTSAGGAYDMDGLKVSDDWTIVDTPPAPSPERWLIGAGGTLTGLFPTIV